MGLLSSDGTRSRIIHVIKEYQNLLAFTSYIIGLCWFLMLPYPELSAKTYFSENALIPGLVEPEFVHDFDAGKYYTELKNELKTMKQEIEKLPLSQQDERPLYSIPHVWLESKFKDLGLEVYLHNYSFQYPDAISKHQITGKNVYGILRAGKCGSTEALVLSVPYRSMLSEGPKTAAGVALMLALAKQFHSRTYWAKDIIFLVTEHETFGMQAWLAAYHYDKMNYIYPAELVGRSGSIQACVNLELSTDQVSYINVKTEGLNGQLPNLDLVNTVVKLTKQHNISPAVQNRRDGLRFDIYNQWLYSLKTMLLGVWKQASGSPSGNHGLFHRYHIEALTLQGVKIKGAARNAGFTEIGKVIEGTFRSLNNLMERFHQSFFFYFLPSTDRYVSIGLYMPSFGLLLASILIKAVAKWIESEMSIRDFVRWSLPVMILCLVFGVCTCYSPFFFLDTAKALHMKPGEGLAIGFLAITFASMFYPYMLRRKQVHEQGDWKLLKSFLLLVLGVGLAATALLNISLAYIIVVFFSPVIMVVRPTESRFWRLLQSLLMLLISPACVAFWISLVNNNTSFAAVYEEYQHMLLQAVLEKNMLNSWLFTAVTSFYWPIWLLTWSLLH